jgi:hypothetical protein
VLRSIVIFIFGAARSGTTWLAKLFDSHPDLLYLHEPDITDRGTGQLPFWFDRAPSPHQIEAAKRYLNRLTTRRASRTVGIHPFFAKNYRGRLREVARLSLIYGSKVLERTNASVAKRIEIPDMIRGNSRPRLVVKSVSALGRAEAILKADPSIAPVLLIRHPCGFVSSMLRGKRLGVMETVEGLGQLVKTRSAARLGLASAALDNADEVALLAWTWLVSNAEAQAAFENANGSILIYDAMAAEPLLELKNLFLSLALGWPSQTESFLARSQESDGDYYSVFRNAKEAAQRWRRELDAPTVAKIRSIVAQDPRGSQFFDR